MALHFLFCSYLHPKPTSLEPGLEPLLGLDLGLVNLDLCDPVFGLDLCGEVINLDLLLSDPVFGLDPCFSDFELDNADAVLGLEGPISIRTCLPTAFSEFNRPLAVLGLDLFAMATGSGIVSDRAVVLLTWSVFPSSLKV